MKIFTLFLISMLLFSCSPSKINSEIMFADAKVIIYKTNADYSNNVPVGLNAEKDMIVSYPSPADLFFEGELAKPLELKKGYYLDRRGIGLNTAFTSYTYEEYAKLPTAPSTDELLKHIIDADPISELYHCGSWGEFEELEKELIKIIRSDFAEAERLK